jgi:hypothetical protein
MDMPFHNREKGSKRAIIDSRHSANEAFPPFPCVTFRCPDRCCVNDH